MLKKMEAAPIHSAEFFALSQARLNFDSQELELTPDPAGFGVHVVVEGELTSHVEPVRPDS